MILFFQLLAAEILLFAWSAVSVFVVFSFFFLNDGERLENKHLLWWVPSSCLVFYGWNYLLTSKDLVGIIG